MNSKLLKQNFLVYWVMSIPCLAACSKMDASYVDFIKGGKIIYPGKADSVQVYPGKNRIQLSWLLIDPKVVSTKIYWNNRADSLDIPVKPSPGTDSLKVMLTDMEEGAYVFELYTYDEEGNQSVRVEAPGRVYGEDYIRSLLTKPVRRALLVADTARVYWGRPTEDVVGTELEYMSQTGAARRILALAADSVTLLPGYKPGTSFRYRTLFLPDPAAIDTFYTDYDTLSVEEPLVDLALGKPVDASSDFSGGRAEGITDGDEDTYWQPLSSDRSDLNVWADIDLESAHTINEIHIHWSERDGQEDEIASYQLLVSDDGANWQLAFEKSSGILVEEKATFPEATGRYLRLNITFYSSIILRTHGVNVYHIK